MIIYWLVWNTSPAQSLPVFSTKFPLCSRHPSISCRRLLFWHSRWSFSRILHISNWQYYEFIYDQICHTGIAFFLVLATILIMRIHSCYSCVKVCRQCGRRNIRGSIVDGLSAFLVLCYFQCASITSWILTPSKLLSIHYKWYITVALFDGELDYLKGAHLWYAVPAFLCMIFILIPPPTILILEPILTKLFSMDCFTSTPPKWYYNRLRLKLMPFLDSFQACFKDRHRYFAGLYFLYRLLFITITSIFVHGPQSYYGFVICLFMVIILLHVFLRPYKKRWHDLLEIFLFINIIFLLIITLYNFAYHQSNGTDLINAQLVLISLSIEYMVVYIAIKLYRKFRAALKKETPVSRECTEVNDSLPYRLLNDNNEVTISNSYRTFWEFTTTQLSHNVAFRDQHCAVNNIIPTITFEHCMYLILLYHYS